MNLVPRSGGNAFRGQAFYQQCRRVVARADNLDDSLRAVGIVGSARHHRRLRRERVVRRPDQARPAVVLRQLPQAGYLHDRRGHRCQRQCLQRRELAVGAGRQPRRAAVAGTDDVHRPPDGAGDAEEPLHLQPRVSASLRGRAAQGGNRWLPHPWRQLDCLGTNATTSPEAATNYFDFPYYLTQGTWSAPMTNRLLLEAGFVALLVLPCGRPGPAAAGRDLRPDLGDGAVDGDRSGYRHPLCAARELCVPRGPDLQRQLRQPEPLARLGVVRDRRAQHEGRVSGKLARSPSRSVVTPESLVQYRFNLGVAERVHVPPAGLADGRSHEGRRLLRAGHVDHGTADAAGALRYDRAWSYSPADGNGTTKTSHLQFLRPITFDADSGRERLQRHHPAYRCRVRRLRQRQDGHQVQLRPLPRRRHERQHLHAEQPGEQDRAPGAEPFLGRQRSGLRDRL